MFRLLGLRFSLHGLENVPTDGPAVLASNHLSYLDFTVIGLAAKHRRRLGALHGQAVGVRQRGCPGPLMRAMRHIPVDRTSGAAAYRRAVRALSAGELVGNLPRGHDQPLLGAQVIQAGRGHAGGARAGAARPGRAVGGPAHLHHGQALQLRPRQGDHGGAGPGDRHDTHRYPCRRWTPSCAAACRPCSTTPGGATPTSRARPRTGGGCRRRAGAPRRRSSGPRSWRPPRTPGEPPGTSGSPRFLRPAR